MSRVAITGALSYTGRYPTRELLDTTSVPVSSILGEHWDEDPVRGVRPSEVGEP